MSCPYDFQCWLNVLSFNIQCTPGGIGAYCASMLSCQASMPSCLAFFLVVLPCTWFFLEPQVYDHPIGRRKTLYQLTVPRVKLPESHLYTILTVGLSFKRNATQPAQGVPTKTPCSNSRSTKVAPPASPASTSNPTSGSPNWSKTSAAAEKS